MFPYYIQGKTVKDLSRHFMKFYRTIVLILQFFRSKNNKSMYNLQSKTVNCYSQNSLRHVTPHSKVFCLNNHVFFIIFLISYVHLGFMLHLLLFNESLLHYYVCYHDVVLCLHESLCAPSIYYTSLYFCLWRSYL